MSSNVQGLQHEMTLDLSRQLDSAHRRRAETTHGPNLQTTRMPIDCISRDDTIESYDGRRARRGIESSIRRSLRIRHTRWRTPVWPTRSRTRRVCIYVGGGHSASACRG